MPTPQPKIGQNETGTFEKSYPTPADDVALTAQLASNAEDYAQTLYGTPPPENTNPDFLLVNEVPIDWMLVKRKYVQDRTNEGTYNASISYSGESKDHPIFTRDYLVRRANYVPLTKLSSLAGLINAAVTAKGSGYTVASVVLTGGTGSGGAVTAIISNGKIVHFAIASEGNYTVAPALSIVGDGLGATGSVSVQPATALLVKEDYLRQQDSDLDGLYVLVRRIYETLPGPLLSKPGFNSELGMATTDYRQRVALPASPDALGSVISGQVVVDSYVDPGNSTVVGTRITECWAIPPSRVERQSIGYEFPAQFVFIIGWFIPVTPGFLTPGPFPGVNFTMTAHRTLSTPASRTLTYSNGPPTVSETVFVVTTPGAADRFFGIRPNTIHNSILLIETASGGATQTVENLPASTPSSYTPGSTLIIRASSRLVKGTIWEKEVVTGSE